MKMRVLICGWFHHKNIESLHKSIKILGFELVSNIHDANVIFSGSEYINTEEYPEKFFVFGPHFCVLPDKKLLSLSNKHKNSIYIVPCQQIIDLWNYVIPINNIPLVIYPFGVNTSLFYPKKDRMERNNVLVYYKHRHPDNIALVEETLCKFGIKYTLVKYGNYTEEEYISLLSEAKWCFWVGCHESQGFALLEALSMDVPLLVWSSTRMSQEFPSVLEYKNINHFLGTNPCWSDDCGEVFYSEKDIEITLGTFIQKIDRYKPREYIVNNLSEEHVAHNLVNILTHKFT